MRHFTTPEFWQHFDRLPEDVQRLAKKEFELLKENPRHPSLRLKKAGKFWSVRIGSHYRGLAKAERGIELVLDRSSFRVRQSLILRIYHGN